MDPKKMNHDLPGAEHLEVLKKTFGFQSFRPDQSKVNRKFPPVFLNKIAVVVSPLISPMEDQVLALQRNGIKAVYLGSMRKEETIELSDYQIIYLTPEFFDGESGKEQLKKIKKKICLVAIDEFHCITQWSSNFRPTFLKLGEFKSILPDVPIVSLTAATNDYCEDEICKTLKFVNPFIVKGDLNRPNLEFSVTRRGKSFIEDVKPHLIGITEGSVIIYVLTRHDAENFADKLKREGFICQPYHAGLSDDHRHRVLKDFSEGSLHFVVATIAFGMEIDRSDVRAVIHYGCSRNIDSYYQESGRAGRDGAFSKCIIFWDEEYDFSFHRDCQRNTIGDHKIHCEKLLDQMKSYLISNNCRRWEILRYFDPSAQELPIRKSCCDNCTRKLYKLLPLYKIYEGISKRGRLNVSDDCRILLKLALAYKDRCPERESFKILMGEVPRVYNINHPYSLFAVGKSKPESYWSHILNLMIKKKLISRYSYMFLRCRYGRVSFVAAHPHESFSDLLRVTKNGIKFLRYKTLQLKTKPTMEMLQRLKKNNRQCIIYNGKIRYNLRQTEITGKVPIDKSTGEQSEVYCGSTSSGNVNDGAGCSKWLGPSKSEETKDKMMIELTQSEAEDNQPKSDEMLIQNPPYSDVESDRKSKTSKKAPIKRKGSQHYDSVVATKTMRVTRSMDRKQDNIEM